jgi:hypothetical protein
VAAASGPSIKLSKSIGVVGNEVITVTGKGFPANTTVVICEYTAGGNCVNAASSPYRVTATTNVHGAFPATDYTLQAGDVGVNSEPCGAPRHARTGCYMQASGGGQTATSNLTFAIPRMKVSSVPSDGAVGNDAVSVTGMGFPVGDTVDVYECSPTYVSSRSESDCDTSSTSGDVANSHGAFEVGFKVLEGGAYSDSDSGVCLPTDLSGSGYCEIAATDVDNTVMTASSQLDIAPLVFNVAPTIFPNKDTKNGPATGLVTVSGIPTGDEVFAVEAAPLGSDQYDPDIMSELWGVSKGTSGTVAWEPFTYPGGYGYPTPATGNIPILTEDTTPAFQGALGEGSVTPSAPPDIILADVNSVQAGQIEAIQPVTIK